MIDTRLFECGLTFEAFAKFCAELARAGTSTETIAANLRAIHEQLNKGKSEP